MEPPKIIGIVVATVVLLGVYLYLSFDTLDPTQGGIDFDAIWYRLGRLEDQGRYWLGLGHSFIKFPLTLQTIEFSGSSATNGQLRSRTSDGLEVLLEVSLQFKLVYENIPDIYAKFGPAWMQAYRLFAMDTINREATSYSAYVFFSERTTVQNGFRTALSKVFEEQAFATLPYFQLRTVSLPALFETAIQETEVQKQDIRRAAAERDYQEVYGQTTLLVANQSGLVKLQQAEADSTTVTLNVDAYVEAFDINQGLASTEYAEVFKALQSNEDALLEYQRVRALFSHPATNSIVNIKLPGAPVPAPLAAEL